MRRYLFLILLILCVSISHGQEPNHGKITSDLWNEMELHSKTEEMFNVIIVMNEQFDVRKCERHTQHLDKTAKREYVTQELQRISNSGQEELLKALSQGERSTMVKDIHPFWIINGVSCCMTKNMVLSIAKRPDVGFIMKDNVIKIPNEEPCDEKSLDQIENQWNITQVHADAVWELGYTGKGIIVAIIDSGVNYNHTDIANNMWDGGTAYPHHGWDFLNNDNDPMDDQGHGTHCAGTISSYGTNGKQCGIAKDAKIMALKTLGSDGGKKSYTWAAIQFAISNGADILSLSLVADGTGGEWGDRIIMENALHCGVVASVAAGNVGNKYDNGQLKYPVPFNLGSPGNCPSPWTHPDQPLDGGHSAAVTVGATTSDDEHAIFSSFGPISWAVGESLGPYHDYPWIEDNPVSIGLIKPDISAPGSDVVSLDYSSNNNYCTKSGTSMATPCVAGIMALMLEADPTLTPREIDSIIETTAVKIDGQTKKNNLVGSGRIDALAAINQMRGVCPTPSNLTVSITATHSELNWTAAPDIDNYRIFRNGIVIAESVSGTTYIDENVSAGENTYYVKSINDVQQTSLPSNQVTVFSSTNQQIIPPSNLTSKEITSTGISMRWDSQSKRQVTLCHTNSGNEYMPFTEETTAAQRFPISKLQAYAGMQIEHIQFTVAEAETTCSIKIYEGNTLSLGTLVYQSTITTTEENQKIDHIPDSPIVINPSKELWLTITTTGSLLVDADYVSELGGDAFYFSTISSGIWDSYPIWAWSFQIGLSDAEYTYNLYQNGTKVASGITDTNLDQQLEEGLNLFYITAVSNGFESPISNTITVVSNSNNLPTLDLNTNDKLIISPNSALTVDQLTNDHPENLIIEDGGRLIHSSTGVKATVKQSIAAYTNGKNGWRLVSVPVADGATPSDANGWLNGSNYDLYYYDEPTRYWKNIKSTGSVFDIDYTKGYLYANSDGTQLQSAGTLQPSVEDYTIKNLSYTNTLTSLRGFNLVGNPFVCNATVNKDFYVMNPAGTEVELAASDRLVVPCEGIFVVATESDRTVTFSRATAKNSTGNCIDLVLARNGIELDRARVRFGDDDNLEKFNMNESSTRLYFPDADKDFAVVYTHPESELPLNFQTDSEGSYSLSVAIDGVELTYLHLIDHLTGADIDLLTTPNYAFDARAKDYDSRFQLRFTERNTNENNIPSDFIEGDLQILDVTGRVVGADPQMKLTPGVYVIRSINSNDIKTEKIIIK